MGNSLRYSMCISCKWNITIGRCLFWWIDSSLPAMFVFVKGTGHLSLKRQDRRAGVKPQWQIGWATSSMCGCGWKSECLCAWAHYWTVRGRTRTSLCVSARIKFSIFPEESGGRSWILSNTTSRKAWLICLVTLWKLLMHADEVSLNSLRSQETI